MMRKAISADSTGPTVVQPPGFQLSKLKSAPPVILPIASMTTSVNALTRTANAAPMMNATASSMRLPRRTKSLKPFMVAPSRGRGRAGRVGAALTPAAQPRGALAAGASRAHAVEGRHGRAGSARRCDDRHGYRAVERAVPGQHGVGLAGAQGEHHTARWCVAQRHRA